MEGAYQDGKRYSVLSLIPSNLDHELTIVHDKIVEGTNDYVVLYGLSNRTDMSELVYGGESGGKVTGIQVLGEYPEGFTPEKLFDENDTEVTWESLDKEDH